MLDFPASVDAEDRHVGISFKWQLDFSVSGVDRLTTGLRLNQADLTRTVHSKQISH